MIPLSTWLLFCVAAVALAVTPGPNLLYLVSRTLVQGRGAGIVSLAGTGTGMLVHILAAALGLSAILAAVPVAYDAVRLAGAGYLLWIAWRMWREPLAASMPEPLPFPAAQLDKSGALTGSLTPKGALVQLARYPQFVDPAHGSVLLQSLILGATQLVIVVVFDAVCVLAAGTLRGVFSGRPGFGRWSKRALSGIFVALALRLALIGSNLGSKP
ncbi:MAG: LysE family translocator [Candidatus Dormibacteria bacterium]